MRTCVRSPYYWRNRNQRRKRHLEQLSRARAAKAEKRLREEPEHEPERIPFHPIQIGLRDKITGDFGWTDLKSGRQAMRMISELLRNYQVEHRM